MAFPGGTYLTQIRAAVEWVADEFEQMYALFQGYLSAEHKNDGSHGAIHADSVRLVGDIWVAGFADVEQYVTAGGVTIGPVTVTGTSESGEGLQMAGPSTGASLHSWAMFPTIDNFQDSLGIFDTTANREVLKLYVMGADSYALCPSEDGVCAVTLGSTADSDLRFDSVAANAYYLGASLLGAVTDVSFNAGNFTSSAGSWTVASGDQFLFRYQLVGEIMQVDFNIATSTVAGTPNALRITIPAGMTIVGTLAAPALLYNDLAWTSGGVIEASNGLTYLSLYHNDYGVTNWVDGTNTVYVQGSIRIRVV